METNRSAEVPAEVQHTPSEFDSYDEGDYFAECGFTEGDILAYRERHAITDGDQHLEDGNLIRAFRGVR